MSLDDGDLSPREAHRRELHQAMRRQHEADLEQQRLRYEEQRELESPEAEERRWENIMRQSAAERESERVYWPTRGGTDRRLFGP